MWVVLNDAFLSVVADRDDPNRLLVRARFHNDIARVFPNAEVTETPHAEAARSIPENLANFV